MSRHFFAGLIRSLLCYWYMSDRTMSFDILRVLGMFFVMLIHTPMPACDGAAGTLARVLKDFIAPGAVPMFFLLSGYLSAVQ